MRKYAVARKIVKNVSRFVATVYFAASALFSSWGAWLLATPDPDGGRHPVGTAMLAVGIVSAVFGVVSLRRSHRRPS